MNGEELFLVKWKGFDASQASWEQAGAVPRFVALLEAFELKNKQENAPVATEAAPKKRTTRRSVAPKSAEVAPAADEAPAKRSSRRTSRAKPASPSKSPVGVRTRRRQSSVKA
jgi:hypothetical protein